MLTEYSITSVFELHKLYVMYVAIVTNTNFFVTNKHPRKSPQLKSDIHYYLDTQNGAYLSNVLLI